MLLKNLFWYFTGALSDQFCDEVIKYGNSKVLGDYITKTKTNSLPFFV